MKKTFVTALFMMLLSMVASLNAQQTGDGQTNVGVDTNNLTVTLGAHTRTFTGDNGYRVVEMATGMNYWDGQKWTPSNPSFVLSPDGSAAVANQVQHKVRLAANINTNSAVTVITPDGITLNSTPVAIGLYDAASGNFSVIASITNSIGFLVSSNKVVYSNAFVGLCADLVYTLERGSFEQDVVINGRINAADYGFPTNTTRIQILTEFFQPPEPDEILTPINIERNQKVRSAMFEPDFMDTTLGFGEFVFSPGRAFTAGTTNTFAQVRVGKQFVTITNQSSVRTFLVESVPYPTVQAVLNALPDCNGQSSEMSARSEIKKTKFQFAAVPSVHPASISIAAFQRPTPRLAANTVGKPTGLVVDYYVLIGGSLTSAQVFQGDTTYYVSGTVFCTGAVTIEGGAVFKYPTNSVWISIGNTLTLKTSSYHPAVFTAADDDSVGFKLNNTIWTPYNGSIKPTGYGNPDIMINIPIGGILNNLRFSYATMALEIFGDAGGSATVIDSQLANCVQGISVYGGSSGGEITLNVNNCLLANVQGSLMCAGSGNSATFNVANCTFDNSPVFAVFIPYSTVTATNCIFANSSVSSSFAGNNNGFYNYPTFGSPHYSATNSPFLSVGAANYYLAASNTFRGVGTTNIDLGLLADLRQKTTYPPEVFTVDFNAYDLSPGGNDTEFRDNGPNLDLGYHYDPIDFAFGGVEAGAVTNTNGVSLPSLTFRPGTVIATFTTNTLPFGLTLGADSAFTNSGTANALCHVIAYNTVQEQSSSPWTNPPGGLIRFEGTTANSCRFVDFSVMAHDTAFIYSTNNTTAPINLEDCQFHGGMIYSSYATFHLTNCLFERVAVTNACSDGNAPYIRNCLFRGGNLDLTFSNTNALIQDNLFDGPLINDHGSNVYTGDYNAYIISSNHLTLTNSTDVFLTNSPVYQYGELGNYYLPTNSTQLIDKGSSANAEALGLYLYCTTTNELAEANSTVDIGYHYVALHPTGLSNMDIPPDLLYYRLTEYVPITLPIPIGAYSNYSLTLADSSSYSGTDTANGVVTGYSNNPVLWRPNQTALYTGGIHWRETVLDTGDTVRFNFTTNLFTINVWVQALIGADTGPTGSATDHNVAVMGNGTSNLDAGWWVVLGGNNNVILGANTASGLYQVETANTAAPSGQWKMLTFVRTTTNVAVSNVLIYVNGSLQGLDTTDGFTTFGNPASSANSLIFGQYNVNTNVTGYNNIVLPYDGDFGVIRIYSNALTSNQIVQLYTNGESGLVR